MAENILLYPTITPALAEDCGLDTEKYKFSYEYQNKHYGLQQKGTSKIKLTDPLEIWKIESEGLSLTKTVRIAYPHLFKGESGVICQGAELGICIIWTNRSLTQTGYILPYSDVTTAEGRTCRFQYTFEPGLISGDLELELTAYVKRKADDVLPGEENFINEDGVTVGTLETVILDFNSIYMEFPIEECHSENEPLWWVEFTEWEDPKTIDMFSKDSLCLYLNSYYDACPAPSLSESGDSVRNQDLLIDILAQTYFLIFQRLSSSDLQATRNGVGLTENTICSVMHAFIEKCSEELQWDPPQSLLKGLQVNIRKLLEVEPE